MGLRRGGSIMIGAEAASRNFCISVSLIRSIRFLFRLSLRDNSGGIGEGNVNPNKFLQLS